MIRGTDGLDYETLSDRFLGIPAKTPYNLGIQYLRNHFKDDRYVQRWLEIYDYARAQGEPPIDMHTYRILATSKDLERSPADAFDDLRRRYAAAVRTANAK